MTSKKPEDVEMGEAKVVEVQKMWIEKYRPSKLEDLISHTEIINIIKKLVNDGKLPHLLFYGPPGTGKTSTIIAIAKQLYGTAYKNNVLELNASDERGIDVVREKIKTFASTRDLFGKGFKLIILDEADHMTKDAQGALRRIIEQYTKHTRFCMICNYVNKIIPALQSRCTKFRFAPLKQTQISQRLQEIAQAENVTLTKDGIAAIFKLSNGDMRKCLQILQSTYLAFGEVNEKSVMTCTGNPQKEDMQKIMFALLNSDFESCFKDLSTIKSEKGLALVDIVRDAFNYVLKLSFAQDVIIFLVDKMAQIEHRLAAGANEKLQMSALIGAFQIARESTSSKLPISEYTRVAAFE